MDKIRSKEGDNTKCDKDVRNLGDSAIAGGNGTDALGNSLAVFLKPKHATTRPASNGTPKHLSQKNRDLRSRNYLETNVYRSFICIAQNWEQPRCPSTGEWLEQTETSVT